MKSRFISVMLEALPTFSEMTVHPTPAPSESFEWRTPDPRHDRCPLVCLRDELVVQGDLGQPPGAPLLVEQLERLDASGFRVHPMDPNRATATTAPNAKRTELRI